jgi:hypothetical protein
MQDERKRVQQWLEDLRTELDECSFQLLMTKVEEERKDQELLHEVKKKEREATGTVRSLETDLQKEYSEHEKEMKSGTDEIKKLKEELQELKTRSAIETSFLEKKLRAKENATLRIFAQKDKALQEEYDHLQKMIALEEAVHGETDEFMTHRLEKLGEQTEMWKERAEREIAAMELRRDKLREDRGKGLAERTMRRERQKEDLARLKAREEEQRNQVMMEKQQNEQAEQEKSAILALQDEGRKYILRIRDRAALKKQKKGKKGKKKK